MYSHYSNQANIWFVLRKIGEVKELIKYYLNHPQERKEIAQKGHSEVLEKHTYAHRINELLKAIGKL